MNGNPHRISRAPTTSDFVSQHEIPLYLTGFPVILYTQDTGWTFRDAHTHDHCVRYLDLGAHTATIPPVHSVATEAGFPSALTCGVP
jgi:acetyl esterase/lipase